MYKGMRLKDFLVIKDPEVAKLFADSCRRSILHNLRHYEMTPCQLAKALGKNVSSIIHHLNALEKAGLVEQSRSVVKGNLIEKFYRTTAKIFIISYTLSEGLVPGSEDIAKWSREVCESAVTSLKAFGYDVPPEKVDKLLGLIERYSSLEQIAYEKTISLQRAPIHASHPALKLLLRLLANVRLFNDSEFLKLLDEISTELKIEEKRQIGMMSPNVIY